MNLSQVRESVRLQILVVGVVLLLVGSVGWIGFGFVVSDGVGVDTAENPFRQSNGSLDESVFPGSDRDVVVSGGLIGPRGYVSELRYDSDTDSGIVQWATDYARVEVYFERNEETGRFVTFGRTDLYEEKSDGFYPLDSVAESSWSGGHDSAKCTANSQSTAFEANQAQSVEGLVSTWVVPVPVYTSPLVEGSTDTYSFADGFVIRGVDGQKSQSYMSSSGELEFEGGKYVDSSATITIRNFDVQNVGPVPVVTGVGSSYTAEVETSVSYEEVSVERPAWVSKSECFE